MESLLDSLYSKVWDTDLKSYPCDVKNFFLSLERNLKVKENSARKAGLVNHQGIEILNIDLRAEGKYSFLTSKSIASLMSVQFNLSCYIDEYYSSLVISTVAYEVHDEDISLDTSVLLDGMIHNCFEIPLMELETFNTSLYHWEKKFNKELDQLERI